MVMLFLLFIAVCVALFKLDYILFRWLLSGIGTIILVAFLIGLLFG